MVALKNALLLSTSGFKSLKIIFTSYISNKLNIPTWILKKFQIFFFFKI